MNSQHISPDTLLTTLYCLVDDIYSHHFAKLKPPRPGIRPELSDSEVLTLMLLAQWRQDRSERAFVRYAMAHWRPYFPRLLSQSAFNRRTRDLWGVLCSLAPVISQQAIAVFELPASAYEVLDGVPVPLMRRNRGKRHRLFGPEADVGRGGSDRDWYYGIKLLGAVNIYGFVTGFVSGPASTEERWLAEALFRWRQDPTSPVPTAAELASVLGPAHRGRGQRRGPSGPLGPRPGVGRSSPAPKLTDLGYAGVAWNQHWRNEYAAHVLTQGAYNGLGQPQRGQACRWLNGLRQLVETIFSKLDSIFGLKFPRARTRWGLYARLGAKMAAHNLALYLNYLFGHPGFAFCDPFA